MRCCPEIASLILKSELSDENLNLQIFLLIQRNLKVQKYPLVLHTGR